MKITLRPSCGVVPFSSIDAGSLFVWDGQIYARVKSEKAWMIGNSGIRHAQPFNVDEMVMPVKEIIAVI